MFQAHFALHIVVAFMVNCYKTGKFAASYGRFPKMRAWRNWPTQKT